jgi:Ser/Thr protein kinase RdoA (MazF antagonist)
VNAFAQMTAEEQATRMSGIARKALHHWGLDGDGLKLIKYRENAVFEVTSLEKKYALRVHRPGYHSNPALRSELLWIDALADAGIEVPRIVPTLQGELFAEIHHEGMPVPLPVDLFEWIEGRQLGSVETGVGSERQSVSEIYRTLGELAGALHNHSAGWKPPSGFVRHAWDENGLAGEQPFWGRFWELERLSPDRRKLLSAARKRVHRDLAALPKDSAHYNMIHADFAPENLLVDGNHVRLIDFDDAGFGWYLFELVTSLYFIRHEPYFDEARDALILGYRRQRPLDEQELRHLPLFFLARSFTYVGWVHTRPETETARELTPMLVEASCDLAENYLGGR